MAEQVVLLEPWPHECWTLGIQSMCAVRREAEGGRNNQKPLVWAATAVTQGKCTPGGERDGEGLFAVSFGFMKPCVIYGDSGLVGG